MTAPTLNPTPDLCRICITHPAVEFGLCAPCLTEAFWLTDPLWSD